MRIRALVLIAILGLSAAIGLSVGRERGPVAIGPHGEFSRLSSARDSRVAAIEHVDTLPPVRLRGDRLELNLHPGPVVVVARAAGDPTGVYGLRVLAAGQKGESDVWAAVDEIMSISPTAYRLPDPVGGGYLRFEGTPAPPTLGTAAYYQSALTRENAAGVVEIQQASPSETADLHVRFATFRKVCEAGCAPWPQDLTCCTILGCSGTYKDCIVIPQPN